MAGLFKRDAPGPLCEVGLLVVLEYDYPAETADLYDHGSAVGHLEGFDYPWEFRFLEGLFHLRASPGTV